MAPAEKIKTKKFIPAIVWFLFVLFLMCIPGSDLPQNDWLNKIHFDKFVHVGVFGLLTFLFSFPFYKSGFSNHQQLNYFIKIAIAISFWGLTIEFIQKYFVPGRSFDLLDWAADSVGAFLAFLFSKYQLNNKIGRFAFKNK